MPNLLQVPNVKITDRPPNLCQQMFLTSSPYQTKSCNSQNWLIWGIANRAVSEQQNDQEVKVPTGERNQRTAMIPNLRAIATRGEKVLNSYNMKAVIYHLQVNQLCIRAIFWLPTEKSFLWFARKLFKGFYKLGAQIGQCRDI